MKVVYHPRLTQNLSDYGISIPLDENRSSKCFSELKKSFPQLQETNPSTLPSVTKSDFLRAHCQDFVERFFDSERIEGELLKTYELVDERGEFFRYHPHTAKYPLRDMREVILGQVSASFLAMLHALEEGFCFFLGGGMHHAMSFGGRGFCPVHDIFMGLKKLQSEGHIQNAWVVDTDAHKGDGTAELAQNDASVQTLSIHMAKGWPLCGPSHDAEGKLHPWFLPSTLDIPIPAGGEKDYLPKLEAGLSHLEKHHPTPDLAVMVAGADPYEKDLLPSTAQLKLSREELLERDLLTYRFFASRNIPQCWLMAGGYGPDSYRIYLQFLQAIL